MRMDGPTDGHTGMINYAILRKRLKTACLKVTDAQKATSAEHRSCVMFAVKYISCEAIFPKFNYYMIIWATYVDPWDWNVTMRTAVLQSARSCNLLKCAGVLVVPSSSDKRYSTVKMEAENSPETLIHYYQINFYTSSIQSDDDYFVEAETCSYNLQ